LGIDKIIAMLDMNNHEAVLIEKDMDTDKDKDTDGDKDTRTASERSWSWHCFIQTVLFSLLRRKFQRCFTFGVPLPDERKVIQIV
jgi:DnaJ-domain-containing protein 1